MVNNSSNFNKTKESLNCDGQQFHQYQQSKRNFKQWWSTIPPISTKQKKVETVMVYNSTNINKTEKFKQWWSTIPPISTKQKYLNSDGQ